MNLSQLIRHIKSLETLEDQIKKYLSLITPYTYKIIGIKSKVTQIIVTVLYQDYGLVTLTFNLDTLVYIDYKDTTWIDFHTQTLLKRLQDAQSGEVLQL